MRNQEGSCARVEDSTREARQRLARFRAVASGRSVARRKNDPIGIKP